MTSRIESRRTENKRFTHDWFLDNFSNTYSCNTTRHGYIHASDCMLETRPIQAIRRMFLQGHLYQASFPQLKFQILLQMQTNSVLLAYRQQHVYFVTSISGLIQIVRPLGLIKISCNIHVVFVILENVRETMVSILLGKSAFLVWGNRS